SASESSRWLVPGCGIQVPPRQASEKAAVGRTVGPVNVLLAGVVQSTWNFQTASWFAAAPSATTGFGAPAGGRMVPSRSAGRRPQKAGLVLKHCWVADAPVSMRAGSKAQTLAPWNTVPAALNMLKVA